MNITRRNRNKAEFSLTRTTRLTETATGFKEGITPICIQATTPITQSTSQIVSPNTPVNGVQISFPTSPTTIIAVASESADDAASGQGAQLVRVFGLAPDGSEQFHDFSLNGQAPVPSINGPVVYWRINGAQVIQAGSLGSNQGDIHIATISQSWVAGQPTQSLYHTIEANTNVARTGTYTVPKGKYFIINRVRVNGVPFVGTPGQFRQNLRFTPDITNLTTQTPVVESLLLYLNGDLEFTNESFPALPELTDISTTYQFGGSAHPISLIYCGNLFEKELYPDIFSII